MALEDERAAYGIAQGAVGIVKEGHLNVVKSDPTLFDNLKSSAKKRFCVLRRLEGGECTFEIRKTAGETAPKVVKVAGAQIKSTKKGKTVLEIETTAKDGEKAILLECEETSQLEEWLVALQTAIAFANKEDALSTCSELDKASRSSEAVTPKTTAPDTESIGSEDSSNSRTSEMQPWRGRNSAARALQPPIVERRNMFSLYYRLQPLPVHSYETSTILPGSSRRPNHRNGFPEAISPSKAQKSSSLKRSSINPNLSVSISSPVSGAPMLVSIDFHSLSLRLPTPSGAAQQIEPFYVRLFVFDAIEGRRICEEFQILVNGEELHVSEPVFDSSMKVNGIRRSLLVDRTASRALVQIPNAHRDMWLVCRVDRVLSADTGADLYMK